jgi:hypothetical protein
VLVGVQSMPWSWVGEKKRSPTCENRHLGAAPHSRPSDQEDFLSYN